MPERLLELNSTRVVFGMHDVKFHTRLHCGGPPPQSRKERRGEPGAIYIMGRSCVDFGRLFLLHIVGAFFIIRKWIKQHLRIKSFLGTSENAVMRRIWI